MRSCEVRLQQKRADKTLAEHEAKQSSSSSNVGYRPLDAVIAEVRERKAKEEAAAKQKTLKVISKRHMQKWPKMLRIELSGRPGGHPWRPISTT